MDRCRSGCSEILAGGFLLAQDQASVRSSISTDLARLYCMSDRSRIRIGRSLQFHPVDRYVSFEKSHDSRCAANYSARPPGSGAVIPGQEPASLRTKRTV